MSHAKCWKPSPSFHGCLHGAKGDGLDIFGGRGSRPGGIGSEGGSDLGGEFGEAPAMVELATRPRGEGAGGRGGGRGLVGASGGPVFGGGDGGAGIAAGGGRGGGGGGKAAILSTDRTSAFRGGFRIHFQEYAADPAGRCRRAAEALLASPRFGEHWARHWMDLMRYAETHGSEGDPEIPQAWRYRDYLIRAFNADVPGDQLIREHLAGDLLAEPRMNPDGFNESILGTAQFRLVEHGFQPMDTLDEQVKTIDNQIDVVSKAFQGLTISCARCHDHKFDAISQRDYYALYGIFASAGPRR